MRIKGHAVSPGNRTTAHVQLVTPDFSVKVCTPALFENVCILLTK